MAKFATLSTQVGSPIATEAPTLTHEGGVGYSRDAKSELFMLAVSHMVGEQTFYESATARDERYVGLIFRAVADDPAWVAALVPWLRDVANLRSVAIVTAAEYVAAGGPNGRQVVGAALKRPDEPGEMLAYWLARHGRKIPYAIKMGAADAAVRLYNQTAALKWDGGGKPWRFGDVLDLAHPKPKDDEQSALFRYLLGARRNRGEITDQLAILAADARLRELPEEDRRAALNSEDYSTARWSWERLSGWLPGGMDAQAWEAAIPNMGIMARLRNLRNFDQAGVSDAAVAPIIAQFSDPSEVAKSEQLPFRWYSAWREAGSLRWAYALEQALEASLANVPRLRGRTLVMVDVSGSMQSQLSGRSQRARWELAALFGTVLAKRAESADLIAYDHNGTRLDFSAPTLRMVDGIRQLVGGGTNTFGVLQAAYAGHDRVVILTDEQARDAGHYDLSAVPKLYTFNLGGYAPAHVASGSGHFTFGGLSDACFTMMDLIERGREGKWPHLANS